MFSNQQPNGGRGAAISDTDSANEVEAFLMGGQPQAGGFMQTGNRFNGTGTFKRQNSKGT
jgi:hypothetical protein